MRGLGRVGERSERKVGKENRKKENGSHGPPHT